MTFPGPGRILLLGDHGPERLSGETVHLRYLERHFRRSREVEYAARPDPRALLRADVWWIRSEKWFLACLPAALAFRKRVVYDLASFPWLEHRAAGRPAWRATVSMLVFRAACRAAVVRVLSRSMKAYLVRRHGAPAGRLVVFPIPVDLSPAPATPARKGPVRFVFTGADRSWQGLASLVAAFGRLAAEGRAELHCYGAAGRGSGNVFFHDPVPHAEMTALVGHDMDVVVVPRPRSDITEHVLPIKYAEALALRKWVLATDLPVLREFADARVVFVADNEPETLVRGIRRVCRRLEAQR